MMLSVTDFSNFTFVDVTLIIEQNAIIALIRNIDIKRFNISVFVNKCRDFCSYVHNLTTVIFKVVRFVIDIIERYSSAILNFGNFRKPSFFKPQFQVYFISVFYLFYGNFPVLKKSVRTFNDPLTVNYSEPRYLCHVKTKNKRHVFFISLYV